MFGKIEKEEQNCSAHFYPQVKKISFAVLVKLRKS